MPYHFVVAEIPHKESGSWVLGDELGEVRKLANGTSRNLHLPLNGLPTADFVLRMDDPLASQITDRSGDVLLKIYRDSTLTFIGQATLVSEEGEEDGRHTLACNFAGPLWVLGKRLFAKSVAGYETTGTAAQTLITNLIALTNEEHDTGIRGGTLDSLYAVPYAQTHYKPINELITEIQAAKVPFPVVIPPAYVGRDTMTDTANVALTAHTPETGGAWTGAGDATDFTVLGTTEDVANRQEVSDASAVAGRWAISGAANQTDVLVGVDWQTSVAGASGHNVFGGVFARYTDQNNWLLAYYNLNTNQIGLDKKVAGTQTTIGTYTFPSGGFTTAPRLVLDPPFGRSVRQLHRLALRDLSWPGRSEDQRSRHGPGNRRHVGNRQGRLLRRLHGDHRRNVQKLRQLSRLRLYRPAELRLPDRPLRADRRRGRSSSWNHRHRDADRYVKA